jgi:hypothetical protein
MFWGLWIRIRILPSTSKKGISIKLFFVGILKVTDEKSRIQSLIRIRIRTKMLRIWNTVLQKAYLVGSELFKVRLEEQGVGKRGGILDFLCVYCIALYRS